MTTPAGRGAMADDLWSGLTARLPAAELGRIGGALDVWAGRRRPEPAPGQRCMFDLFAPGIPAQPWYDPAAFAFRDLLEAHHEELRRELVAALAGRLQMHPFGRAPDGAPLPTGAAPAGWNELKLWWRIGPVAATCALLPRAAAIMRDVVAETRVLSLFSFLALEPGGRAPEHTDPINALASCHLGIVVPDGCGLRVGGESRSWVEGKCIAFDNSYPHEAWNDHPTATRLVLAVHGPHPDLTVVERDALAWLATRLLGPG